MTEQVSSAPTQVQSSDSPNALMNAGIGALITLLTAPILPFAAIVGGGVSGYLQRRDLREGATVGGLAGGLASIPIAILIWFIVGVGLLGYAPPPLSVFALAVFLVTVAYLVGAGALGGAIGAYLRREL